MLFQDDAIPAQFVKSHEPISDMPLPAWVTRLRLVFFHAQSRYILEHNPPNSNSSVPLQKRMFEQWEEATMETVE